MDIDAADLSPKEAEHLVNGLVIPRPIAWITTIGPDGTGNLAPFSYYNAVSSMPPIVVVAFSGKGKKDTLANIKASGEFVVNIVSHRFRRAMVASSADLPAGVDEAEQLELKLTPSRTISVPRLSDAAAALECRLHHVESIYNTHVVFGAVQHFHADDEVVRNGRVVAELLAPVARLGGSLYTTVTSSYRLERPKPGEPISKFDAGTDACSPAPAAP